jgi:hypothetical protein
MCSCVQTLGRKPDLASLSQGGSEAKQREAELAQAVMLYLAEHPHAMDSAHGIAEWWVMRDQVQVDLEALGRVLGQLMDKGLIEKVDSANGPLYRLSR